MKPFQLFKGLDKELEKLNIKLSSMGMGCGNQLTKSAEALLNFDIDAAHHIVKKNNLIKELHEKIDCLVQLIISKRNPKGSDLRYLLSGVTISSNLERIGGYIANIADFITQLEPISFKANFRIFTEDFVHRKMNMVIRH